MQKTNIKQNEVETSKVLVEDVLVKIKTGLMYLPMLFGVFICLFPFYYMLILATKTNVEIFSFPPPLWFGDAFSDNLGRLLNNMPFYRNIFNSIFVAVVTTVATLFFCSLAGYGFAKYKFKHKEKLFFIMLVTMTIPPLLSVIPWFIMMKGFNWINTFKPLIIPGMANAFGIFLMRQFMEDIPDEVIEAARIDGCGELEIFFRIVLPMSLPGLGTLGLLTFLGSWNNYMAALLILQDEVMYTIPVALSKLGGKVDQDWGAQMVGTTLAIAPMIVAFVVASKQFISGITAGATKG